MAKKSDMNVGGLLFFYIWLTGWSCGVAAIQSAYLLPTSILGDDAGTMSVFVITHGGSEVFVLWHITRELKKHAAPPELIDYRQELDKHILHWRNSVPHRVLSVLAAVLAVIVYSILFTPIVLSMVAPYWSPSFLELTGEPEYSLSTLIAIVLFSGVWIFTMRWWVQAYRVLRQGLTTVEMVTTPNQITVTEKRPGLDPAPVVFQTGQVNLALGDDEITLSDSQKTWQSPFPYFQGRQRLEPVEQAIAAAQPAGRPEVEEVPEALKGLRTGPTDSE